MKSLPRWALLDQLASERGLALPRGIYVELAERIREAIYDKSPDIISRLADQIAEIIVCGSSKASPEATQAVRQEPSATVTSSQEAYALGQLGFAYTLAAHAAEKRVDANFEELLGSEFLTSYVGELLREDLTGVQLATRLAQRPETVSRNLKRLRDIGAVDCRRDGTSFVNFLTPAARHVAEQQQGRQVRTGLARAVRDRLHDEARELPMVMRASQTFSQNAAASSAGRGKTLADV